MLALTRAAYRTQHRAMALQAALLAEAVRVAATGRFRRADRALSAQLARRFEALMARDLANVEAGLYPRQLLFQMPIARYVRRLPALIGDLPRVAERARRRDFRDLPAEVDLAVYPPYYRRTFHWQTDGYLSRRSAELYDLGVELLFGGTADVMRRQVIPPVSRLLRAASGPARLLDVACGTGRTLHQIAVAHPDLPVVGLDLSRFYLESAARLLRRRRAALVVGNGEALPFASGGFDAVTCVYLLHELPLDARRRVIAEARRVLRPGGLLILEDACQPADSPELAGALAQFQKDLHEPYFRSYLEHDLAGLVGEAGFTVDSVEPHLVSVVVVARAT